MNNIWRDGKRWFFAMSVPWLTHKTPVGGDNLQRFFADQIIFLRSFARNALSWSSVAIQLRYWTPGTGRGLRCNLLGAAESEGGANDLLDHTLSALPRGLPLESLSRDAYGSHFCSALHICEVRRSVTRVELDRLRTEPLSEGGVLVPWNWTPSALESALYALSRREVPTALAVNIRPTSLTESDRALLFRWRDRLVGLASREPNNLLASVLSTEYAGYLRDMHESCIDMRVLLVSDGPLGSSLPHVLGSDLSSGGISVPGLSSYEVASPTSDSDSAHLLRVVGELSEGGAVRRGDRDMVAFASKYSMLEANVAFRFPVFANDLVISDW